jgi:hypothetical protein
VPIDNLTVTLGTPTPMPVGDAPPAPSEPTHVPEGGSRTFDFRWNGTWERGPGSGIEDVPAGNYALTATFASYEASTSIAWLRGS